MASNEKKTFDSLDQADFDRSNPTNPALKKVEIRMYEGASTNSLKALFCVSSLANLLLNFGIIIV
jgi:hypothetical protein